MTLKRTRYRLGIDLGTNSLGWAAIELDSDNIPCGIVDLGVRVFADGRDGRSKTSNAVDRRLARGQRRRRDRYLKRRRELMGKLVEFGLMPKSKVSRESLQDLDPYELRARALDRPLARFELGRALLHLDQRRGFKSNRKAAPKDEDQGRRTAAEIAELWRKIDESGARTLGEYFHNRRSKSLPVRARPGNGLYPVRDMYEAEFDTIRESQQSYQLLSNDSWDHLRQVIFYQRPLKPVEPGWCRFEPDEKRAARALPVFQEFRLLQEVNNLRLRVGPEPERPLSDGERGRILARLRSGKDVNLIRPLKSLRLPDRCEFNLASAARTTIKGDETAARLAVSEKPARSGRNSTPGLFGDGWFGRPLVDRNQIVKFLLDTEDPDLVRQRAVDHWGLDESRANAVANVVLADGYGSLSEKAQLKMIPHLELGLTYSDAAAAAGYHHSDFRSQTALDRLPYYGKVLEHDVVGADIRKDETRDGEVFRYGRIPNPTVHIGLGQLRRVVNSLIDAYGKPEEIVVELGRDLKLNREQKRELLLRQRQGARQNDEFRDQLRSAKLDVTSDALRKLRLWCEQGPPQARRCPYSGQQISFAMVVSHQTEIDHILPFSRTLDNSMANMVLCVADANRVKGNRSPYEAFGHNPTSYDYTSILELASNLPSNKRWRFQPDAMNRFDEESRFLDRQLNETRYLSRTARAYLASLFSESTEGSQRVRVIPGRMTALLRRGWGLEGILRESTDDGSPRKQRDDHRHHAIDAFVVANTTQGLLQKFAHAAVSFDNHQTENLASLVPEPWLGFSRSEFRRRLDQIAVSHRPNRGSRRPPHQTSGRLLKETAYGLVEFNKNTNSILVTRKAMSDITKSDLLPPVEKPPRKGVRDLAMREALLRLWNNVNGDRSEFARHAAEEGVLLNGRMLQVRRVRVMDEQRVVPIADSDRGPFKGYISGGNEFADVWRMRTGTWKMVVVPRFYANQKDFDIESFRPVTTRGKHKGKPDPWAKRLMRLQIDDMCAIGRGDERRILRVRKITNASQGTFIVLDDHNEANVSERVARKDMKEGKYTAKRLLEAGFRKIRVDEIGNVLDSGPVNP